MKVRFKLLLIISICLFGITLYSCNNKSKVDSLIKDGKVIQVRYNANGGTYLDREGITLIDMFDPNDYQKDANGEVHIKLLAPTDSKRPAGGSEGIYITRTNYFLVGWYQNRVEKKNSDGKLIDENGKTLIEKDGKYYLEEDETIESAPDYEYSGYWDFENDTVDYKSDMGTVTITLYAVWSTYFEFNYYYQKDGKWESFGNTTFDYVTTNAPGSKTFDKDTIWLPEWNEGALVYTHKYSNNSTYTFPKVNGKTFTGAYLDEELTQKITGSFEHTGTIDIEKGVAVNPVQNIYCTFDEGEKYYISKPEQLIANANPNGIYEIENDLDFTGLTWPLALSVGEFNGQIYGKNGKVTLSNINIVHSNETAKLGGIFGALGDKAVVKDITFDNATIDFAYLGRRNRDASFGFIAGNISEAATVSNVEITGTMKIGAISLGDESEIHLIAGGDTKGLSDSSIHLIVYGTQQGDVYSYTYDPETVTIEDGKIIIIPKTGVKLSEEFKIIK